VAQRLELLLAPAAVLEKPFTVGDLREVSAQLF
jgi:hypothetical protein